MAARTARRSTQQWKDLNALCGVDIHYEQPGAIWIADNSQFTFSHPWLKLENDMHQEVIDLQAISNKEVEQFCQGAVRVSPGDVFLRARCLTT